jgi:HAD superfamily hydrolase (TIGR01509 family)
LRHPSKTNYECDELLELDCAMALLIFDCDGVLVDSEPIACGALAELMTSLGHAMTTAEVMREFGGRSLADTLAGAERLLGRPIPPEVSERAGLDLLARFRRELEPVAGVRDAIAALPYRRCVASSSVPERIRVSLAVTGLAPLFGENVYSATEVKNGKPAPDLFLHAAAKMGVAPAHAIVIEDSPVGVRAARAAGMTAIGFAGASHASPQLAADLDSAGAARVITAMADLPSAVAAVV